MAKKKKEDMGQEPEEVQEVQQGEASTEAEVQEAGEESVVTQEVSSPWPPEVEAEIKKLRREAAQWRVKYREAEAALAAQQETKKVESGEEPAPDVAAQEAQVAELKEALEKARREAEEATAALQQERDQAVVEATEALLRASAIVAAAKLGFRNPEIAYKVMDLDGVEVGEDGEITGVEEALKKLAEQEPWMLGGATSIGATNPAKEQKRGRTREELEREYFGGGESDFWRGGGVRMAE